ncbi:MAG: IS200/IS605 family transposase [Ardenticatenaceae bacterium]|nr:IS200/IS605 family transposase [Ardenticatenaceae bacterium]
MPQNKLGLYVHLVWATWDRQPMIEPTWERRLFRSIADAAAKLRCGVIALNGMPKHVHLLVSFPTTVRIADIAKQVKGESSHFVNEVIQPAASFKWQGSYEAYTVSRWDLDRVIAYIRNQKAHHTGGTLDEHLEATTDDWKPAE